MLKMSNVKSPSMIASLYGSRNSAVVDLILQRFDHVANAIPQRRVSELVPDFLCQDSGVRTLLAVEKGLKKKINRNRGTRRSDTSRIK